MWKVGGIKIERTRARSFSFRCCTENGEKSEFFGDTLRSPKLSMGDFFGESTHGIFAHLGFR